MIRLLLLSFFLFFHKFSIQAQYCLTHVNIVNVENGRIIRNQTVCIDGNAIKSISDKPIENSKGTVYDCTGKFLMPGLWDMHIHDAGEDSSNRFEYMPLFISNGVTGVRDMWGSEEMLKLKSDIDAGRFIGPRMIIGSPIIDGEHAFFHDALKASTEAQGRHLVDSLFSAGYDFIKIYSLLREPVYLAIADECKKKDIYLEGHLPIEIGLEEALDAGQRSYEHNFNIDRYLTGKEKENIQWAHGYLDTVQSTRNGIFMIHGEPLGISENDFHIAAQVLDKMIEHRAAIVPTLTLSKGRSLKADSLATCTRGLGYLSHGFVDYWKRQPPVFPQEFIRTFGAAAKFLMDKGVLILAGTDVNNPFCVPGFGLQQELINLREAGFSNLQILQTATINPAKFLYKEKELGTVTAGKLADLLVLEGNPLQDISNTQKINAVIANGKYFSKEDIAQMLKAEKKRFGN